MPAAAAIKQTIESHRGKSVREKTLLLVTAIISTIVILFVWTGAHGVGQYLLKSQAEEAAVYWLGALQKHFLDFDCVLAGDCASEDFYDTANLVSDAGPVFSYGFLTAGGRERVVSWSRGVEKTVFTPYLNTRLSDGEHIVEFQHEDLIGEGRPTVVKVILPMLKRGALGGTAILYLDLTTQAKQLRTIGAQLFVASILILGVLGYDRLRGLAQSSRTQPHRSLVRQ